MLKTQALHELDLYFLLSIYSPDPSIPSVILNTNVSSQALQAFIAEVHSLTLSSYAKLRRLSPTSAFSPRFLSALLSAFKTKDIHTSTTLIHGIFQGHQEDIHDGLRTVLPRVASLLRGNIFTSTVVSVEEEDGRLVLQHDTTPKSVFRSLTIAHKVLTLIQKSFKVSGSILTRGWKGTAPETLQPGLRTARLIKRSFGLNRSLTHTSIPFRVSAELPGWAQLAVALAIVGRAPFPGQVCLSDSPKVQQRLAMASAVCTRRFVWRGASRGTLGADLGTDMPRILMGLEHPEQPVDRLADGWTLELTHRMTNMFTDRAGAPPGSDDDLLDASYLAELRKTTKRMLRKVTFQAVNTKDVTKAYCPINPFTDQVVIGEDTGPEVVIDMARDSIGESVIARILRAVVFSGVKLVKLTNHFHHPLLKITPPALPDPKAALLGMCGDRESLTDHIAAFSSSLSPLPLPGQHAIAARCSELMSRIPDDQYFEPRASKILSTLMNSWGVSVADGPESQCLPFMDLNSDIDFNIDFSASVNITKNAIPSKPSHLDPRIPLHGAPPHPVLCAALDALLTLRPSTPDAGLACSFFSRAKLLADAERYILLAKGMARVFRQAAPPFSEKGVIKVNFVNTYLPSMFIDSCELMRTGRFNGTALFLLVADQLSQELRTPVHPTDFGLVSTGKQGRLVYFDDHITPRDIFSLRAFGRATPRRMNTATTSLMVVMSPLRRAISNNNIVSAYATDISIDPIFKLALGQIDKMSSSERASIASSIKTEPNSVDMLTLKSLVPRHIFFDTRSSVSLRTYAEHASREGHTHIVAAYPTLEHWMERRVRVQGIDIIPVFSGEGEHRLPDCPPRAHMQANAYPDQTIHWVDAASRELAAYWGLTRVNLSQLHVMAISATKTSMTSLIWASGIMGTIARISSRNRYIPIQECTEATSVIALSIIIGACFAGASLDDDALAIFDNAGLAPKVSLPVFASRFVDRSVVPAIVLADPVNALTVIAVRVAKECNLPLTVTGASETGTVCSNRIRVVSLLSPISRVKSPWSTVPPTSIHPALSLYEGAGQVSFWIPSLRLPAMTEPIPNMLLRQHASVFEFVDTSGFGLRLDTGLEFLREPSGANATIYVEPSDLLPMFGVLAVRDTPCLELTRLALAGTGMGEEETEGAVSALTASMQQEVTLKRALRSLEEVDVAYPALSRIAVLRGDASLTQLRAAAPDAAVWAISSLERVFEHAPPDFYEASHWMLLLAAPCPRTVLLALSEWGEGRLIRAVIPSGSAKWEQWTLGEGWWPMQFCGAGETKEDAVPESLSPSDLLVQLFASSRPIPCADMSTVDNALLLRREYASYQEFRRWITEADIDIVNNVLSHPEQFRGSLLPFSRHELVLTQLEHVLSVFGFQGPYDQASTPFTAHISHLYPPALPGVLEELTSFTMERIDHQAFGELTPQHAISGIPPALHPLVVSILTQAYPAAGHMERLLLGSRLHSAELQAVVSYLPRPTPHEMSQLVATELGQVASAAFSMAFSRALHMYDPALLEGLADAGVSDFPVLVAQSLIAVGGAFQEPITDILLRGGSPLASVLDILPYIEDKEWYDALLSRLLNTAIDVDGHQASSDTLLALFNRLPLGHAKTLIPFFFDSQNPLHGLESHVEEVLQYLLDNMDLYASFEFLDRLETLPDGEVFRRDVIPFGCGYLLDRDEERALTKLRALTQSDHVIRVFIEGVKYALGDFNATVRRVSSLDIIRTDLSLGPMDKLPGMFLQPLYLCAEGTYFREKYMDTMEALKHPKRAMRSHPHSQLGSVLFLAQAFDTGRIEEYALDTDAIWGMLLKHYGKPLVSLAKKVLGIAMDPQIRFFVLQTFALALAAPHALYLSQLALNHDLAIGSYLPGHSFESRLGIVHVDCSNKDARYRHGPLAASVREMDPLTTRIMWAINFAAILVSLHENEDLQTKSQEISIMSDPSKLGKTRIKHCEAVISNSISISDQITKMARFQTLSVVSDVFARLLDWALSLPVSEDLYFIRTTPHRDRIEEAIIQHVKEAIAVAPSLAIELITRNKQCGEFYGQLSAPLWSPLVIPPLRHSYHQLGRLAASLSALLAVATATRPEQQWSLQTVPETAPYLPNELSAYLMMWFKQFLAMYSHAREHLNVDNGCTQQALPPLSREVALCQLIPTTDAGTADGAVLPAIVQVSGVDCAVFGFRPVEDYMS